MRLRFPGEIELKRSGNNEGVGRGFDQVDLSADATRVITAPDSTPAIVARFSTELGARGWSRRNAFWFDRDGMESFVVRTDWDRGESRIASSMPDAASRKRQLDAEIVWYAEAPREWSVLTLCYLVAPESSRT